MIAMKQLAMIVTLCLAGCSSLTTMRNAPPVRTAASTGAVTAMSPAEAAAKSVEVRRRQLGSGTPENTDYVKAIWVVEDIYMVPQYLPGTPTASSIWPRVIDLPCVSVSSTLVRCEGYEWSPSMGRAEYLYIRPIVRSASASGPEGGVPSSTQPR